jgi:hypothetical protein
MLVTFSSRSYPNVTLFGDVALHLLKAMGHSGTVPGAIMAEDVPQALDRLKAAVAAHQAAGADPAESADGGEDDDESDQRAVSLAHRALPLIELLESAARNRCNVMWDK